MRKTVLLTVMGLLAAVGIEGQTIFQRADSILTKRYHEGDVDTAYIVRPQTVRRRDRFLYRE